MLESLVTSKAKRRILGLLFTNPKSKFYLREVCRKAKVRPNEASIALESLSNAGILTNERRGNMVFYAANPASPIYHELKSIVLKTEGLGDIIRNAIEKASGVKFAFIYGSYARGEEREGSDIDLMVIGNPKPEGIASAIRECQKTIGRDINYSIYPENELLQKKRRGYIEEVLKGKKVMLVGAEDELERFVI